MRAFISFVLMLLALMLAGERVSAQSAFGGGKTHIRAALQAETLHPHPRDKITLAFVMTPEPGWHGYWLNPGDAGKPIEARWDLPAGVTIGHLRYPVPGTLLVSGLMNHVYEGRYAVLAELSVPRQAKVGQALPLRARLEWLACTDAICVPEQASLALNLTVAGKAAVKGPENRTLFDEFRRAMPRPLGGKALFTTDGEGGLRLSIPYPASATLDEAHVFIANAGAKSYAGRQAFIREGDRLIVTIKDMPAPAGGALNAVLRIGQDRGLEFVARPGRVSIPSGRDESWRGIMFALLGAIGGGLLLNIMPCVFPVLSLKAMSLLRGASSPAAARKEAWAYTVGVMSTCVALGGAVLALRAAGQSIGWAFQLQNPAVVLLLLALSLAIALELAGVYRLAAFSVNGNLVTRRGLIGDFWSGVLVAFVASPCTGPFMAGALGAALVLPMGAALAVFAGLGLGIALPFLLLGHIPALRRIMPRPGVWMERVQFWLSIPMALTAAGLLWLLWRQTGAMGRGIGLAMGAAIIGTLWGLGRAQRRCGRSFVRGALALALVVIAGGAGVVALKDAQQISNTPSADGFSEATLARARATGKPIFLYFTADWCLSCKVNEAGAIDRTEVRAAFERADVQGIVAEWTNGDPVTTRFLESRQRSGVPLYLWYPPKGGEPTELPQILTPAMLIALAKGEG